MLHISDIDQLNINTKLAWGVAIVSVMYIYYKEDYLPHQVHWD